MPRTRTALTVGDWERLTQSITEETTTDAPELQLLHEKLGGFLAEFQQLVQEQRVHDARKQAVTLRMNEILEDGRRTASALKAGLKLRFGNRNEELVRFGIQPLRKRKQQVAPEPSPGNGAPQPSGEPST